MRACAVEDELDTDELGEIVASFEDVIWLSRELIGSTNFRLHDVPLKVYDRKLELGEKGMLDAKERLVDYHRYPRWPLWSSRTKSGSTRLSFLTESRGTDTAWTSKPTIHTV